MNVHQDHNEGLERDSEVSSCGNWHPPMPVQYLEYDSPLEDSHSFQSGWLCDAQILHFQVRYKRSIHLLQ